MACRVRKSALIDTVAVRFDLPDDKAADLVEMDMSRVRRVIESEYQYDPARRQWIEAG